MESDKVVGMRYFEALAYIEGLGLWHEVIGLMTDSFGIVVKVIH